jgi:hypothetical protein
MRGASVFIYRELRRGFVTQTFTVICNEVGSCLFPSRSCWSNRESHKHVDTRNHVRTLAPLQVWLAKVYLYVIERSGCERSETVPANCARIRQECQLRSSLSQTTTSTNSTNTLVPSTPPPTDPFHESQLLQDCSLLTSSLATPASSDHPIKSIPGICRSEELVSTSTCISSRPVHVLPSFCTGAQRIWINLVSCFPLDKCFIPGCVSAGLREA